MASNNMVWERRGKYVNIHWTNGCHNVVEGNEPMIAAITRKNGKTERTKKKETCAATPVH